MRNKKSDSYTTDGSVIKGAATRFKLTSQLLRKRYFRTIKMRFPLLKQQMIFEIRMLRQALNHILINALV